MGQNRDHGFSRHRLAERGPTQLAHQFRPMNSVVVKRLPLHPLQAAQFLTSTSNPTTGVTRVVLAGMTGS